MNIETLPTPLFYYEESLKFHKKANSAKTTQDIAAHKFKYFLAPYYTHLYKLQGYF